MSAGCSGMPTLELRIAESGTYRCLHALLCALVAFSLYRIDQRGYSQLALVLLLPVVLCCWRLAHQRLAGCRISWHQGRWSLGEVGDTVEMELHASSTCIGHLVYLAWVESVGGERHSILLFPDSIERQSLRRLRVCLTLQR